MLFDFGEFAGYTVVGADEHCKTATLCFTDGDYLIIIVTGITKWLELPAATYVGIISDDYQMFTNKNTSNFDFTNVLLNRI